MTYKSRQYSEKDGHKLMKAIIAQKKSYNNEQEKKRKKRAPIFLERTEGNVGDVINNIDLVMASNTQESQEHNNNNYELCVDNNNISKKGEFKRPNFDIENYKEEDMWDYINECNKWEGGDSETIMTLNRIEC
jgi:hypothetical protein